MSFPEKSSGDAQTAALASPDGFESLLHEPGENRALPPTTSPTAQAPDTESSIAKQQPTYEEALRQFIRILYRRFAGMSPSQRAAFSKPRSVT